MRNKIFYFFQTPRFPTPFIDPRRLPSRIFSLLLSNTTLLVTWQSYRLSKGFTKGGISRERRHKDFVKLAFCARQTGASGASPSLRLHNQRHRVLTTQEKQAKRITKEERERKGERKKRQQTFFYFKSQDEKKIVTANRNRKLYTYTHTSRSIRSHAHSRIQNSHNSMPMPS